MVLPQVSLGEAYWFPSDGPHATLSPSLKKIVILLQRAAKLETKESIKSFKSFLALNGKKKQKTKKKA